MNNSTATINGLVLPRLLIKLMESGKWKHPGDEVIKTVIPFLQEPVDFLCSIYGMQVGSFPEHEHMYLDSGTNNSRARSLPWLDSDLAAFIAVNRHIGDDIAIALDFRISRENPRVVASNYHTGVLGCPWEEVSPNFEEFVKRIGIRI